MTWNPYAGAGCPFGAGPTCRDCDGRCWEPAPLHPPEPEPCQGCSIVTGSMTECVDWCAGLHNEDDLNQRIEEYREATAL